MPALVSALSRVEFNITQEAVLKGTPISDTVALKEAAFDSLISTKYSSAAATCYIGLDFGASQQAHVTKIRYFPNPAWKSATEFISGATIKGSTDGTTYTTLTTLDSSAHSGWNIWKPATALTIYYRYVRFAHTSTSKC